MLLLYLLNVLLAHLRVLKELSRLLRRLIQIGLLLGYRHASKMRVHVIVVFQVSEHASRLIGVSNIDNFTFFVHQLVLRENTSLFLDEL